MGEKELKARNDELLTTNKEEKGSSKVTQFAGSVAGLGFLFPKRQLDSFDNKLHQMMKWNSNYPLRDNEHSSLAIV